MKNVSKAVVVGLLMVLSLGMLAGCAKRCCEPNPCRVEPPCAMKRECCPK